MQKPSTSSTIVARATAAGPAAISIVRMSGPEALNIAKHLWRATKNSQTLQPNVITLGWLYDEQDTDIDQALLVYMKSPHSYTGEDTIEFHLHGSPLITQKVIDTCLQHGAVMAQPGEFTQRAYLAGKIDLTQAEAVAELIGSNNDRLLRLATQQLAGTLSRSVRQFKQVLLQLSSHNAASLDFSEEDIDVSSNSTQLKSLKTLLSKVRSVLKNNQSLTKLRSGVHISLVGLPNAGKSTLLNSFLGYNRTIVTDIAGTTRDTITETISIDGVDIHITDTAGLRNTKDKVEKIGIKKSHQEIEKSDLVLVLVEPDRLSQTIDYLEATKLTNYLEATNTIFVMTKSDLNSKTQALPAAYSTFESVSISTKSRKELQPLIKQIQSYIAARHFTDDIQTLTTRQIAVLKELEHQLKYLQELVSQSTPADIVLVEYQKAIGLCNNLTGEDVTEEVINEVFSNFCIGK